MSAFKDAMLVADSIASLCPLDGAVVFTRESRSDTAPMRLGLPSRIHGALGLGGER